MNYKNNKILKFTKLEGTFDLKKNIKTKKKQLVYANMDPISYNRINIEKTFLIKII